MTFILLTYNLLELIQPNTYSVHMWETVGQKRCTTNSCVSIDTRLFVVHSYCIHRYCQPSESNATIVSWLARQIIDRLCSKQNATRRGLWKNNEWISCNSLLSVDTSLFHQQWGNVLNSFQWKKTDGKTSCCESSAETSSYCGESSWVNKERSLFADGDEIHSKWCT